MTLKGERKQEQKGKLKKELESNTVARKCVYAKAGRERQRAPDAW